MSKLNYITLFPVLILTNPINISLAHTTNNDLNFNLSPKSELIISGQVNALGFVVDDGIEKDIYFADNDNAMSYLNIAYNMDLSPCVSVASQIEVAFSPNNSTSFNQSSQGGNTNSGDIQRVEVGIQIENLGTFTVGKGSMASDETTEYDLSDTAIIIYSLGSGIGHELFYRRMDVNDSLSSGLPYNTSNPQIGSNVDNLDGADQIVRFRYDTPQMCGFRLATSIGENQVHDLAVHFAASPKQGDISDIEAGLGITSNIAFDPLPFELFGPDAHPYRGKIVSGSFSILLNNGLNFTAAAAAILTDTINVINGAQVNHRDPRYYYAKLGYKANVHKFGQTALGVDFGIWQHLAQNEARTEIIGIGINQHFDALPGLEIYGGWRHFSFSGFNGNATMPTQITPYHNISWFGAGASFSFEKVFSGD